MCPRSSDPFYIRFLLFKTGHYFLYIQYYSTVCNADCVKIATDLYLSMETNVQYTANVLLKEDWPIPELRWNSAVFLQTTAIS